MGSREGSSFEYSADNCGHIVDQAIAFNQAPRESEAEGVVKDMRNRYQNRADRAGAADDKQNNPLIAIPASPGSGKSTFIVQFPASAAYNQYLKDTDRSAAIVSTLTFNSGMDKNIKINDVGRRIMFGGMRAMLGSELFPMKWRAFLEKFKAQNIPACDAVDMLRHLFGLDRPVLLLVDELSKAVNDKEVMGELGTVLAQDGNCDVVVTSLSPAYVFGLLSGSQRPITYIPMSPLLSTTAGLSVGAKECTRWADRVNVAAGGVSNPFKLNILKHAYLLASGHPRSLEYLIKSYEEFEGEVMGGIVSKTKDGPLESLTFEVAEKLEGRVPPVEDMTAKQLEDFVFTAPTFFSVENEQFRKFLEKGTIFLYRKERSGGGDKFITAVQARSFLPEVVGRVGILRLGSEETPRIREAAKLLQNLKYEPIATWRERFVDTTIACRSYSDTSIEDLFGLPSGALGAHGFLGGRWDIGVDRLDLKDTPRASPNKLTVPQLNQPGCDSRVHLNEAGRGPLERPMRFYIQAKIQKPGKESTKGVWNEIIAKMVVHNLLDHMELSPSVAAADVFMVLYNWAETGEEMVGDVDRDNVTMQALKKVETLSKKRLNEIVVRGSSVEDFSNLVQLYLSQHWGNVQMVGRERLQTWLLPTLVPFPHLFTGMGIGLDPDAE
ncbi:hypothetical protein B484DRAFT_431920 [Ochromonadaceae sp. CCMP2298]|nr:hypothetical protein B484DRAFT_431920 [Ochromonadaceae sp. CCMP2298]